MGGALSGSSIVEREPTQTASGHSVKTTARAAGSATQASPTVSQQNGAGIVALNAFSLRKTAFVLGPAIFNIGIKSRSTGLRAKGS